MSQINKNPVAETMESTEESSAKPWQEVTELISGPGTHWLATVGPNGRPHVVPVGAVCMDGAMYFTTGQGTRKEKNIMENPSCVVTISTTGFDLIFEGDAAKLTDNEKLERLAAIYRADGWPATVKDGAFDAPYSAPTTGPAPYEVYEITPTTAFALGTNEETVHQCTRYKF